MAFQPKQGLEPIKGYRLENKLGIGGYGEVWRVTAPGSLPKAIKFVFGSIGEARASQELKSLSRIRDVRHPFLLSLERFEIVDGQLLIVTELADSSVIDRFAECRKAGLPGIPRQELLVYIGDAADALDYMSANFGLQHLDIKPQNLLLVGGRVKVADFGLVKDLEGATGTVTGGVTPFYATPEAFEGRVTRFSDQYSLAIVYQEMLTGIRPFPGQTAHQLVMQHTKSRPLLDPLPDHDRPALARALAKKPEERFPTCRAMVDSLLAAGGSVLAAPSSAGAAAHPAAGTPSPIGGEGASADQDDKAAILDMSTKALEELELDEGASVQAEPKRRSGSTTYISEAPLPRPDAVPTPGPAMPGSDDTRVGFLLSSDVILRPTLFLGIGGIAGMALRRLKRRLCHRFGDPSYFPVLRLLLLDTDREAIRQLQGGDVRDSLLGEETLLTPLRPVEHYRPRSKEYLRWIDRRWLFGVPRSLETEGLRPLGRLALIDNASAVERALQHALAEITSTEAKTQARRDTGLKVSNESPPRGFAGLDLRWYRGEHGGRSRLSRPSAAGGDGRGRAGDLRHFRVRLKPETDRERDGPRQRFGRPYRDKSLQSAEQQLPRRARFGPGQSERPGALLRALCRAPG